MTRTPAVRGLLAGLALLVVGGITQAFAQQKKYEPPSPAQMLDPKLAPKIDDVIISTPAPDELRTCTVEIVAGGTPGSSAVVLMDGTKKPLRRYFDSNGDQKVDVWSYYKDGVEVYREFDSTFRTGKPNNFRWLNGGGMKWGAGNVDPATNKASIDFWRMISAEEAGQEAFQAIARRDYARLKILFINAEEMQLTKLSPRTIQTLTALQQGAPKKFQEVTARVSLAGARFERVEGIVPSCVLEEGPGGEAVVIKYFSRPIQYEVAKRVNWLHTGEIIQVGMAWRLVDVPSDKDPETNSSAGPERPTNKELDKLLEEITQLDRTPVGQAGVLARDKTTDTYLRRRITLVQKILALDKADQREMWYRQLFDNLTAMAQNMGDESSIGMLKQLKDDVVGKMPASNLAAYGTYRDIWTRNAISMATAKNPNEVAKIQELWLDQLGEFVKTYAKSEDAPEALYQLGNGSEYSGKDEEAKRWYKQLHETFPNHHLAPRAQGCVARLDLVGKELKLTAPLLQEPSKVFDMSQLRGKIAVVHYWSSESTTYADDFVRLKRIMDEHGQKLNVELVCVNLDDDAGKAREALRKAQVQGIHLFQAPSNNSPGAMNNPLAVQYGIQMQTTMLVGRDGRVTNRALQISDLVTELKKVQ